jgi:hypothetical protein
MKGSAMKQRVMVAVRQLVVPCIVANALLSHPAHAQTSVQSLPATQATLSREGDQRSVVVPVVPISPTGRSAIPISAAEAAAHAQLKWMELQTKAASYRSEHYPIDSMRTAAATNGAQWLRHAQRHPIVGMQLDPSGRVGVMAEHEDYAHAQIKARLATPGISLADKGYALRSAVYAFANVYTPERLPIAERYVEQLEHLGNQTCEWQYDAHAWMLWTYYLLGRSTEVVRHGTKALECLAHIPFSNRGIFYRQITEQVYSPTVEALAGQPNGRSRIARLNALLDAAAIPSAAVVAADSDYAYMGTTYQVKAKQIIQANEKLGTPATPLVAHHWLNRSSADTGAFAVNNGKIRIIEMATVFCAPCVHALQGLERLRKRYPDVEPVMLTFTFGHWGNRLVEPEEEVQKLSAYFIGDQKITFPIGIWAGKKIKDPDGGMVPQESPSLTDYPTFGKPMLWVVDGKGIIRRVFTGYDREIDRQIVRTVEFLRQESAQNANINAAANSATANIAVHAATPTATH